MLACPAVDDFKPDRSAQQLVIPGQIGVVAVKKEVPPAALRFDEPKTSVRDHFHDAAYAFLFFQPVGSRSKTGPRGQRDSIINTQMLLYEETCDIEAQISSVYPQYAHIYLKDFPKLKQLFSPEHLDQTFQHQKLLITDALLVNLHHISKDLPIDGDVTDDELKEIFDAAAELFGQINQSEIPRPLKQWLLKLVAKIQDAINKYWISGARGLREAFANVVGEWHLNGGQLKAAEIDAGVKTKLAGLLWRFHKVCMTAAKYKPLIDMGRDIYLTSQ
jgi:hypothetical protein